VIRTGADAVDKLFPSGESGPDGDPQLRQCLNDRRAPQEDAQASHRPGTSRTR